MEETLALLLETLRANQVLSATLQRQVSDTAAAQSVLQQSVDTLQAESDDVRPLVRGDANTAPLRYRLALLEKRLDGLERRAIVKKEPSMSHLSQVALVVIPVILTWGGAIVWYALEFYFRHRQP